MINIPYRICYIICSHSVYIIIFKLLLEFSLQWICTLLGIIYLKLPFAGTAIFLILIGFFSAYQVLVFGMVTERTPSWLGGTMIGIVNMINMISGIIYPILFGNLLEFFWDGKTIEGVPFYGEYAFNMSMMSLFAGLIIGAAGFYFIKYDRKVNA